MNAVGPGALGVLQLQNKPTMFRGSVSHPDTFPFPIVTLAVPGAWVSNVVPGDPKLEHAFVSAAQELVRQRAVALTTNCGFAVRHQRAIAAAVSVPVATSALLMVPLVAALTSGKIGLITFDARPLTSGVLRMAGIADDAPVVIAGLESTPTWEIMSRPDAPITLGQMQDDLLAVIESLRRRIPSVTALLFECAGFPAASESVRKATRLPVYDVTSMANLLMSGVWQPYALLPAAA
jgi:hypothetical protein